MRIENFGWADYDTNDCTSLASGAHRHAGFNSFSARHSWAFTVGAIEAAHSLMVIERDATEFSHAGTNTS